MANGRPGFESKYRPYEKLIRELAAKGTTFREIAEILPIDCTRSSVKSFCNTNGVVSGVIVNKYDWRKWFDGEEHTITYGKDFYMSTEGMQSYISNVARNKYGTVVTSVKGNQITFKYTHHKGI